MCLLTTFEGSIEELYLFLQLVNNSFNFYGKMEDATFIKCI